MISFYCLMILMVVLNTDGRPLHPNNLPEEQGDPSFWVSVSDAAQSADRDQNVFLANVGRNPLVTSDFIEELEHTPLSPVFNDTIQLLPVIRFSFVVKPDRQHEDKPPSQAEYRGESTMISKEVIGTTTDMQDESGTDGTSTVISTSVPVFTTTTTPKTTTEDPWEAFCDEACQEGLAGPECDCAEHPIGRRQAPLQGLSFTDTQWP